MLARRAFSCLLLVLSAFLSTSLLAQTDVIISEYVEGSSNNKAIELYNPTASSINLSTGQYKLEFYFNGSSSAGTTITLTGSVAAGSTYVVANSAASFVAQPYVNQASGSSFYNGDDAIVLKKGAGGTVVDSVGDVGFDPGSEWGSGTQSTADNTIRRKSGVCQGDTVTTDDFIPSTEWDGFAIDTFSGLGSHTVSCGGTPALSVSDVTLNEGDSGTVTFTFAVSLSGPAGAGGVTFNIASADNTASDGNNDYDPNSVTGASIAQGSTGPYNFSVSVNGDTDIESTETFFVNVTSVSGADVADSQGLGTITNDDVALGYVHDVQGSGTTTPVNGTMMKVEGIVTADFQGTSLRGFFIQEEDADADGNPATSEGMFVFCSSCPTPVAEGERVRISGSASEFFGMTQVSATTAGAVVLLEAGNHLDEITPVEVDLPITGDVNAFYEPIEGMMVTYTDTLTVSEYFNLYRYGTIQLYQGGRPFQFTEANAPSVSGYAAHLASLPGREVLLDDGTNVENYPLTLANGSQAVWFPSANGGFSVGTQGPDYFRGGDTVSGLTGVLHWSFSGGSSADEWRLRPNSLTADAFDVENPRPSAPPVVSGSIRVAGANMLNYYTTLDTTSSSSSGPCGPAGDQDCRGADSTAELNRQRERSSRVLCALDAHVAALIEVENTIGAITDLVDAVNARCANGNPYAFINTGAALGTDGIRNWIIYRTSTLAPVGDYYVDYDINITEDDIHNRPPTAQMFEVIDAAKPSFGERFTVVANHLRSRGCSDTATGLDLDQNDGQGCMNLKRTTQAQRTLTWLAGLNLSDPDIVLLGDFNAYTREEPIMALKNAGYTDTEEEFLGGSGYSYVFDGQLGHIDYALTSASLTGKVTGVGPWHINADEVSLFDYNDEVKSTGESTFEEKPDGSSLMPPRNLYDATSVFRASDHDPVLVGLFPVADLGITKSAASDVLPGAELAYTITVSNDGPDTALNVEWTDELPAGTTFVSLTKPEGWSCTTPTVGTAGLVTCSIEALEDGNDGFTLTVEVGSGVAGGTLITNTATLTSDSSFETDDSAETTVKMTADLGISKSASPDPVIAGTALAYTITASNDGPDPAEDVSWTDALPMRTIFLSLDAPAGWSCNAPSVGSTGSVSCSKASFAVTDAVFTVTVGVSPTAVPGDIISNTASISSETVDLWPGNEDDTATAVVGIRTFAVGFDIYNQGRRPSTVSQVEAWLSDRAQSGAFPLGSGYDDPIPVQLSVPAGDCTGNCTPALASGSSTHYAAGFDAPASFGRLEADVASPNAVTPNEDGSFHVQSVGGTTGRVGFLFERYLWVDADTTDSAGQLLPVLKANDPQTVQVAVSAPRFSQLSHLSAAFDCLTGGSGNGTPRLEIHFQDHGTLRIRLGNSGSFSEPCETLDTFSGQNVIGDDTEGRYDTSGLTGVAGPLSSATEYEDALDVAGALVITRIDFVASDSGASGRSFRLDSIDVAPPTP